MRKFVYGSWPKSKSSSLPQGKLNLRQKPTFLLAWKNGRQNPGQLQLLQYKGGIPERRKSERGSLKFCI